MATKQQQQKRAVQVLLLQDVDHLGRSGDLVRARPGYVRNFLLPQKLALVADARALALQAKLQEERRKLAEQERKEAEKLAQRIEGTRLRVDVKVDPMGHMYGSVTAQDIVKLLEEQNIHVDRRSVVLTQPLKRMGTFPVTLRLKEGVTAGITLEIIGEGMPAVVEQEPQPQEDEHSDEE
jgi:large subunit ribosomal protein L9